MAQKTITVEGIGEVLLQRLKGTKHMRMSVRADGTVRVGMPVWMPYKAAEAFIRSQHDWLEKNRTEPASTLITPDMPIGKLHRVVFYESETATRTTTRIVGTEARVTHPVGMIYKDASVQKAAERVASKSLKLEAQRLLPPRLADLAAKHGFTYRSVAVKRLQTRWGSCSSRQEIILNTHLMQLPWHLIDYVIMHELNHTRIMRHGEPFWSALEAYVPSLSAVRKEMRNYSPSVIPNQNAANQ